MSIDWTTFTPWQALSGGILIGLASVVLVLWNGHIAGISGILGGLLIRVEGDSAWRFAFILGLLAAPWLWVSICGTLRPANRGVMRPAEVAVLAVSDGSVLRRFQASCNVASGDRKGVQGTVE